METGLEQGRKHNATDHYLLLRDSGPWSQLLKFYLLQCPDTFLVVFAVVFVLVPRYLYFSYAVGVLLSSLACLSNAIGKFQKATSNFVMFVRPNGPNRFPLEGFSWNFVGYYNLLRNCKFWYSKGKGKGHPATGRGGSRDFVRLMPRIFFTFDTTRVVGR